MQIEVRDLSFSYPKHPVLQHLSFSIPQGELVALLGPNGAGKSTLFRCILGFLRPEGEILLRGRPVRTGRWISWRSPIWQTGASVRSPAVSGSWH